MYMEVGEKEDINAQQSFICEGAHCLGINHVRLDQQGCAIACDEKHYKNLIYII